MKIQLILPFDTTYKYGSGIFKRQLQYAPLTLTTLAALVPPELGAEVDIVDEGVEPLNDDVEADLVGISAVTATAPRAYLLADRFRQKGIPVVLGGVHPTLLPQEAAKHADSIVMGFAEETWPQLLRDFANNAMKNVYRAAPDLSLKNLPLPRRDLLKPKAYVTANTIQASRGCPNKCSYCVIPEAWGARCYHRPVEEVANEIQQMNAKRILFLDPSPVEDAKYIKRLYRALIPLKIKWAGLATTRLAEDAEMLDLAVKSGCIGILIGFESISQAALNQVSKGFSLVNRYRDVMERLHDKGISVLGCFMFGFDGEDRSVFDRTAEFVDRLKIDIVRYAVYTPFPGTAAYKRLNEEGRIIEHDWSRYDNEHVIFRPSDMTPEELQEGLYRAWKQTYSLGSIWKRLAGSKNFRWLSLLVNLGFRYYGRSLPTVSSSTR